MLNKNFPHFNSGEISPLNSSEISPLLILGVKTCEVYENIHHNFNFITFKHSGEILPLLNPDVKSFEVYETIHHNHNFTSLINKNLSTFKVVKFYQCTEDQGI